MGLTNEFILINVAFQAILKYHLNDAFRWFIPIYNK